MNGSLTVALVLLGANGVIGGIDTIWFHEWKGRLPAAGGGVRLELGLHAARDAVYCVVYGTLPWMMWSGRWAVVLLALLGLELAITFADFAVEARVRNVGGGERILHTLMGIVYGAMLAALVPLLLEATSGPTSLASLSDAPPTWLRWTLSAFAAGIAISGIRDAVAAAAGPRAAFRGRRHPTRPDGGALVASHRARRRRSSGTRPGPSAPAVGSVVR